VAKKWKTVAKSANLLAKKKCIMFTNNLETIACRMSSKYQDDSRALCLARFHEQGDPGQCQNLSAKHREECIKAFNRVSPLVTSTLVRACASLDWPYKLKL
jgi:hypothetical protein